MNKENTAAPIALVTGGRIGIGRQIAQELFEDGYIVITTSRYHSKQDLVFQSTPGIIDIKFEIGNYESDLQKINSDIELVFGRLNLLVNNIGGTDVYGDWEKIEPKNWLEAYNRNVVQTISAIKASVPLLLKTKMSSVINIGSSTSGEPGKFNPHYAAAKTALSVVTKSAANFYGPKGIRVNEIKVGPVLTHSWEELAEQTMDSDLSKEENVQKLIHSILPTIPLNKIGTASDVAKLVKFLASSDASWINGSIINLDGGKSRSI